MRVIANFIQAKIFKKFLPAIFRFYVKLQFKFNSSLSAVIKANHQLSSIIYALGSANILLITNIYGVWFCR